MLHLTRAFASFVRDGSYDFGLGDFEAVVVFGSWCGLRCSVGFEGWVGIGTFFGGGELLDCLPAVCLLPTVALLWS